MTRWDGQETVRLTTSKDSESTPRWSPDGKFLAFLSSRDDDNDASQVWLLPRAGGEAEKVTEEKGGVEDFDWSPDGRKLVLVVSDPDPDTQADEEKSGKKKSKKPIVIDRYQFKSDGDGYLDEASQSPLDPGRRDSQVRGADHRRLRRGAPGLVSRRKDHRLRLEAHGRGGPDRQLGHLRDRAAPGRRAAGPDDRRALRQPARLGQPPGLEPRFQVHRLRAGRARQAHLLRPAPPGRRARVRGRPEGPHGEPRPERPLAAVHGGRLRDSVHARGGPGHRSRAHSGRRADPSSAS